MEKVAYWYFRLNGFLQLENFIIHPGDRGGQRTDADILGVRFPNRSERFVDDPNDIMLDDIDALRLSNNLIDIVIAEVKTGRAALNGPWTAEERQNINRVLAAIGCLPRDRIDLAARAIYNGGIYEEANQRIRLIAVGNTRSEVIARRYPNVTQIIWQEVLAFIWERFRKYAQQKADVQQWDEVGRELKDLAQHYDRNEFRRIVLERAG